MSFIGTSVGTFLERKCTLYTVFCALYTLFTAFQLFPFMTRTPHVVKPLHHSNLYLLMIQVYKKVDLPILCGHFQIFLKGNLLITNNVHKRSRCLRMRGKEYVSRPRLSLP